MSQHFHYIIQGYRAETADGGVADVATIDIIVRPGEAPEHARKSDNRRDSPLDLEQVAFDRAREKVSKAYYRVSNVIEHDSDVCPSTGH